MTAVQLYIPGQPVGKGRPRFMRNGHAYTPKKTAQAERMIRAEYQMRYGLEQFGKAEPLELTVEACYRIAKSDSKKKQEQKRSGELRPVLKPDLDNVVKLVMDALNGVAYRDDSQIVRVTAGKFYQDEPGVYIVLKSAEESEVTE